MVRKLKHHEQRYVAHKRLLVLMIMIIVLIFPARTALPSSPAHSLLLTCPQTLLSSISVSLFFFLFSLFSFPFLFFFSKKNVISKHFLKPSNQTPPQGRFHHLRLGQQPSRRARLSPLRDPETG